MVLQGGKYSIYLCHHLDLKSVAISIKTDIEKICKNIKQFTIFTNFIILKNVVFS